MDNGLFHGQTQVNRQRHEASKQIYLYLSKIIDLMIFYSVKYRFLMPQDSLTIATVRHLDLGISEQLARQAKKLVLNKYLIDKAVAEHGASMLARDLHGGGYGPHEPLPFLHHVLPFLSESDSVGEHAYALVPTSHTLGCSWLWRGHHLTKEETKELVSQLSNSAALLDGTLNNVSYGWIKSLGILVPYEGKNRVDFLREQCVENIPAKIRERTYPSPDRIQIYNVQESSFLETWAVLDKRWVQKVSNPSWTCPLLEAYGVTIDNRWPDHFPRPELIQLALFEHPGKTSPLGHPDFNGDAIVDLETLAAITRYQSESIRCAILDLKNIKIDFRIPIISTFSFVLSFLGLAMLPTNWADFRIAAGILFGASLSCGLVFAPLVITKRKVITGQFTIPSKLAPKHQDRYAPKPPQ